MSNTFDQSFAKGHLYTYIQLFYFKGYVVYYKYIGAVPAHSQRSQRTSLHTTS